MLWTLLILAVTFLWATVNITDKHVVTDELRDPPLCVVIYGVIAFLMYGLITIFFKPNFAFPLSTKLIAMSAGIALGLAVFLYYVALRREEVSRVIPLLNFNPVFVLLLATIFLNEFFTPAHYLAIGLLIMGGWLISIKAISGLRKISLTPVLLIVIATAFAFATRSILIRYATQHAAFIQLLPWVGLGLLVVGAVSFAFHHPRIREKLQFRGIEHLTIINIVSVATLLLYIKAIEVAPAVSLVAAFGCLQSFFVFVLATALSKFKPGIIREPLTKKIILMKIIAIALLTAGVILII